MAVTETADKKADVEEPHLVSPRRPPSAALRRLVAYCPARHIPTSTYTFRKQDCCSFIIANGSQGCGATLEDLCHVPVSSGAFSVGVCNQDPGGTPEGPRAKRILVLLTVDGESASDTPGLGPA